MLELNKLTETGGQHGGGAGWTTIASARTSKPPANCCWKHAQSYRRTVQQDRAGRRVDELAAQTHWATILNERFQTPLKGEPPATLVASDGS